MDQAVLYARFSPRPDAAESLSIVRQFETMWDWCQNRSIPVKGDASDADVSGALIDESVRPGIWRAVRMLGKDDILLSVDLSRIGRSDAALSLVRLAVAQKRASIRTCDGVRIDGTPMGDFVGTVLGGIGVMQRDLIRARTSAGLRRRQKAGERVARFAPYGFRLCDRDEPGDSRGIEPEPAEQAVLVTIRERLLAGDTVYGIAKLLNETGAPCRGTKWRQEGIRRIIRREWPELLRR